MDTNMCELQVKKGKGHQVFALLSGRPDRTTHPDLVLYVNLVVKEAPQYF